MLSKEVSSIIFWVLGWLDLALNPSLPDHISTQFSSIWHIDWTLSGATTLGPSRPWSDGSNGGTPYSLKLQHYWSLIIRSFSVILVKGVLPLCRDAVDIFCSPNRLGYQETCWCSLTSLQRCSWYILQPKTTGLPGNLLVESYLFTEMQLVYSKAQTDWTTRTLVKRVFTLCRDAVGVF